MAELPPSRFKLHLGDAPPPFSLKGVDGKSWGPDSFKEKPLLLVSFWCNHCPYVQAWEGRMISLHKSFADRGLATILINSNDPKQYPDDRLERMQQRAHEKGYPFPYVVDESQDVARAYGGLTTPHAFLFDKDRRLVFQGKIDDNHELPSRVKVHYLQRAINATLAGEPVDPAEAPVLGCSIKWKS
jgi:peroxiredoxin